eukprot:TRINITY_DN5377_c0_g1_i1.p1 TRINITY_DN5377_c0_g1~~TRINITY_DN5377_c0_g1_i1.p1  ORF type:complete len:263 (+),score=10.74 TRINITY_DN5377_c0_g1_i1:164-952(+)
MDFPFHPSHHPQRRHPQPGSSADERENSQEYGRHHGRPPYPSVAPEIYPQQCPVYPPPGRLSADAREFVAPATSFLPHAHDHGRPFPGSFRSAPPFDFHGDLVTGARLPRGQLCRVFCKANPEFSLAIQNGQVILSRANSNDAFQQWIKDEKLSTKVKDERGFPSFTLVNKATGQALRHGRGDTQPVLLTEYKPDSLDESILWSMSEDKGEGYRTVRQVNDITLNMDAFRGDKKSGGVRDGTPVVLWKWKKGENQIWKIVPY